MHGNNKRIMEILENKVIFISFHLKTSTALSSMVQGIIIDLPPTSNIYQPKFELKTSLSSFLTKKCKKLLY
jgi:hypothetical protein